MKKEHEIHLKDKKKLNFKELERIEKIVNEFAWPWKIQGLNPQETINFLLKGAKFIAENSEKILSFKDDTYFRIVMHSTMKNVYFNFFLVTSFSGIKILL